MKNLGRAMSGAGLLGILVLSAGVFLWTADAKGMNGEPVAASIQAVDGSAPGVSQAPALTRTESEEFARREAASPELGTFEAGDDVIIVGGAGVILLIIILIILL